MEQHKETLARDMTLEQHYAGIAMGALLNSPTEVLKLANIADEKPGGFTEALASVASQIAARMVQIQATYPNQFAIDEREKKEAMEREKRAGSIAEVIRKALADKLGVEVQHVGEMKLDDLTGRTHDHDKPEM